MKHITKLSVSERALPSSSLKCVFKENSQSARKMWGKTDCRIFGKTQDTILVEPKGKFNSLSELLLESMNRFDI